MDEQIRSIADELYQQRSLLVMGRGYNYATCLEGALVSYELYTCIHTHTYTHTYTTGQKF